MHSLRAPLLGLLALAGAACGADDAPAGPRARNLVLISVDTLRPDHLGCYGYFREEVIPRRRAALLLVLYSASTPAGLLLGSWLALGAGSLLAPVLTGLACGTFLYVAVGDLLPEVFHGGGRLSGVVGLLLGIGAAAAGVTVLH